jgi:hypothetical protein
MQAIKCSWGRHQSKTGSGGAVGASVPLLSGLPGGQLLGGFPGASVGLQQGQQMYNNGQLGQPAAYSALPGQIAYQVHMSCCNAGHQDLPLTSDFTSRTYIVGENDGLHAFMQCSRQEDCSWEEVWMRPPSSHKSVLCLEGLVSDGQACARCWQGQMDYMATSAQLQAAQYGQYAAAQQYQQQPGLLYGAQQLPTAQYSAYPPQPQQPVRRFSSSCCPFLASHVLSGHSKSE